MDITHFIDGTLINTYNQLKPYCVAQYCRHPYRPATSVGDINKTCTEQSVRGEARGQSDFQCLTAGCHKSVDHGMNSCLPATAQGQPVGSMEQ